MPNQYRSDVAEFLLGLPASSSFKHCLSVKACSSVNGTLGPISEEMIKRVRTIDLKLRMVYIPVNIVDKAVIRSEL